MTNDQNAIAGAPEKTTASLQFLADAPELLKVRIIPAEFARLLGVSKQTVSQWIVSVQPPHLFRRADFLYLLGAKRQQRIDLAIQARG